MPEASAITAVLGPTNTGKTHRAVERMLQHASGMIGLPLRLLAREVYDRITTRLGESRVALVTGEEKRIPRHPSYWVCTVEAMPIEREVDFLAVDEIQLAADDQRGHVFTQRLLSARGRRETWFMGADTMRPVLSELVPIARLEKHPRLSRLSSAGSAKLSRLPPRSAVVAFSTMQVYEIAERLRALRGGAAVVLGALSPRTRNAQVALFQSGEVDYLVATDAIGMGLNLDVDHVAFAALRKFDGRDVRDLDAAELAQIAGRAGRFLRDGTFGTVAPLALPEGVAAAIEAHQFPAVRRVLWRNPDLDTTSIDALVASLRHRSPSRLLRPAEGAEDAEALDRLAADRDVRALARSPEDVALLWDVCRIPDFRKLLFESHVALLREVFLQLAGPRRAIDPAFLAARIAEIDDPTGDIDTLVMRIAAIRTWTYVSNHARWVEGAETWRERTRAIEDRLSDALHDRLVQRFVERGAGARRPAPSRPRPRREGPLPEAPPAPPSHPFARLAAMRLPSAREPRAASRDLDRWVESVVSAPHDAFSIDARGRIVHAPAGAEPGGGRLLGQLVRGASLLLPDVRLAPLDDLGAGARSRLLRRLVAFARDLVEELLAPLRAPLARELSPPARGLVYLLEQGLGTVLSGEAAAQVAELGAADVERLRALDVVVGERVAYVRALHRRPALDRRFALSAACWGAAVADAFPRPGAASFVPLPRVDRRAWTAVGYPVFGARAVRADVVDRVARALSPRAEEEPATFARIATWMGCSAREAADVARALGLAVAPEPSAPRLEREPEA